MPWVAVALVVTAVANVALVTLIAGRRWRARRRGQRHAELVARMRRPALELIDGDASDAPSALGRHEAAVFAELLSTYGRLLRGPSRERIVAYFESHGVVDDQLQRLRSRWPWRRATAAFTLGDIGAPRTVPDLVGRLDDRSPDVRAAACRSLGGLGAVEAVEPILAAGVSRRVPGAVAKLALLDIGPASVDPLLAQVTHDAPAVRAAAVQLVGLLGDAADTEAIAGRLEDPVAAVCAATATALGRLGASQARDGLVRALDDRVPAVRTAAATALGEIGGRPVTEALIPLARGDVFEPARAAAEALARIDPALVVRLAGETDAGPHLREAAARAAL